MGRCVLNIGSRLRLGVMTCVSICIVCVRLVYWSDWGRTASIKRASMDSGLHLQTLVAGGLVWPNALAIDFQRTNRHSAYYLLLITYLPGFTEY